MTSVSPHLAVSLDAIEDCCGRWHVVEFSLFGSILRDDFRPDSDVDVMVRFAEGGQPSGFGLRNVLAHRYAEVNSRTPWRTLTEDVPALIRSLDAVLEPRSENDE